MSSPTFRRRDLPHWDVPGATYFVTSCLEGSIPAQGKLDLAKYKKDLASKPRPSDQTEDEWERNRWKLEFARTDEWLDRNPNSRLLEQPELANEVMSSLLHFAGQRYDVLAFVVMPSHFHWVFRPREEWVATIPANQSHRSPREQIMHSIKGYSSQKCNKILGRSGALWQSESYDHWVRDDAELERIILYVEQNPVKAGIVATAEEYLYSSARFRKEGRPLLRV